jgi:hypothetical protein
MQILWIIRGSSNITLEFDNTKDPKIAISMRILRTPAKNTCVARTLLQLVLVVVVGDQIMLSLLPTGCSTKYIGTPEYC